MSETQQPKGTVTLKDVGRSSRIVNRIFKYIFLFIYILTFATMVYWFVASDRYVSESVVMVQNTDSSGSSQPTDLLNMFIGTAGNRSDQLILVEYLTSLDMLKQLDKEFDLRSHYSSTEYDIVSRMWGKDISIEWFYWYFKRRVTVTFDEYTGVVKVQAQAFTPEMAQNITSFLVREGEKFMNDMSHSIAEEQVRFLEKQVDIAREGVKESSQTLLKFQNQKNIASPTVEIANYQALIADLEKQKSELLIKMRALPATLGGDNQIRQTLNKNLQAVEEQINKVRAKLTSNKTSSLNELMDKEQSLKMDLEFKREVYSSTLTGLVKGKMNAARLIKHVSILQQPSSPEYAMKPDRIYCFLATVCLALLILGMLQLLKAVILDHVD